MGQKPTSKYQEETPFDVRAAQTARVKAKYPNHYPLLVEHWISPKQLKEQQAQGEKQQSRLHQLYNIATANSNSLSDVEAQTSKQQYNKLLLKGTATVAEFISVMRKSLKLRPSEVITFMSGNYVIPPSMTTIQSLYEVCAFLN